MTYAPDVQGDTDSTKIVAVGSHRAQALISGNNLTVSRILAKLNDEPDIGKTLPDSKTYLESAYKQAESEIFEAEFLRPFISIDDYNRSITSTQINPFIESLAKKMVKAREDGTPVSCGVLLCGFDENDAPFLLDLAAPGLATNMTHTGFHAIGSGYSYALSRLLFCDWARDHPIDRVLYEYFRCPRLGPNKSPNVGYDWDAVILTKDKTEAVPKPIKDMVDRAWTKYARTPYEVWSPDEDLPLPPDDWKEQLMKYAETIIPPDGGRA